MKECVSTREILQVSVLHQTVSREEYLHQKVSEYVASFYSSVAKGILFSFANCSA